jgi:hypothetical protein
MQNRAPGGAAAPQLGQDSSSTVPHDMQNFAAAGFSVPQFVHVCDAIPTYQDTAWWSRSNVLLAR